MEFVDNESNLSLNESLYLAARDIHELGLEDFELEDLCKQLAEYHNKRADWVMNRIKLTYRNFFQED